MVANICFQGCHLSKARKIAAINARFRSNNVASADVPSDSPPVAIKESKDAPLVSSVCFRPAAMARRPSNVVKVDNVVTDDVPSEPTEDDMLSPSVVRISEEEKAMNGAPDKDLVDVDVVASKDMPVSKNPSAVLALIEEAIDACADPEKWVTVFMAITSLRQLVLHHEHLVLHQLYVCLVCVTT